jgi:hypothetical protein
MNIRLQHFGLGLICVLLFLSGCVASPNPFIGNTVSSAPVDVLKSGGPHADSWQTFDIHIDYEYTQDGNLFKISGSALLSEHYQMMYTRLRDLKLYLFFLDENSRVLAGHLLAQSLSYEVDHRLPFNRSFNVPPGTARISFGYDGRVSEREDRKPFSRLPLS